MVRLFCRGAQCAPVLFLQVIVGALGKRPYKITTNYIVISVKWRLIMQPLFVYSYESEKYFFEIQRVRIEKDLFWALI